MLSLKLFSAIFINWFSYFEVNNVSPQNKFLKKIVIHLGCSNHSSPHFLVSDLNSVNIISSFCYTNNTCRVQKIKNMASL